jgi:hypothetical protein
MKNTTDLRNQLIEVLNDLRSRKIDTTAAKSMVALSNSILKSASVEADYNKFLGSKDQIDFLKTPKK